MKLQEETPTLENEEQPVEELFLLHLRYKESRLVETGGNNPILLDDPRITWVVYKGWADVFAVPLRDGRIAGSRTHLFRVNTGQAIFGMNLPKTGEGVGLLTVGNAQTSMLKISTQRLQVLGQDEEFGGQVTSLLDNWVKSFSASLLTTLPPKECVRLEAHSTMNLTKSASVCAKRGVLWVKHLKGHSQFAGDTDLPHLNGNQRWPISERAWIQTTEESELDLVNTATFIEQDPTWVDLQHFHQQILFTIERWLQETAEIEKSRLQNKLVSDQNIVDEALNHLVAALTPAVAKLEPAITEHNSLLLKASQMIGDRLKIQVKAPPRKRNQATTLDEIARMSHFQTRRVALKGDWWKRDNGPLLAFWEEGKRPIALLPERKSYRLHDPATHQTMLVTLEVAEKLEPFAQMFYRPFGSQLVSGLGLIKFGTQGDKRDLYTILFTGSAVTLLGLFIPAATGFIFDQIIPKGDQGQLIQLSIALAVVVGVIALMQIVQNRAVLRLQGRMGADMQAAVWDRLLSLPVSFFRGYSAGDLGTRAMGISTIQQTLSGTVISAILSGVFSVFSVGLLFYYQSQLALVAIGLVFISVAATLLAGYRQVQYQKGLIEFQGKISGTVLQAIQGIAKFRASGTEGRAFANWAKQFSQMKQTAYKARDVANRLQVFNSGYQVLTSMVIFGMMAWSSQQALTTGQFLAFNAAFIQFLLSMLTLSDTVITILNVVPIYKRAQPILQTLPEVDELKEYPGELTGKIEVSHVSFSYSADGPTVLKDVSLEVKPGEFVALVGSSGSGKTTLFRMLLGFEKPGAGAVYYDGRDLARLDMREVRRQIGVVLQNGQIMAGDIFTNIVGSSLLTIDDAWQAAEMAGLADDIRALPMHMHTMLNMGGTTLSGGQRQRLLIARSIVNRPRILFFDEATSALDNRTQAIVSQSLEGLQATRIVIAHRLSTIMNADKIYVMQNGRITQQGTYQELINQEGLFATLAKRQLA